MRFAQVRLLVRDFDACFRFYRDVMHFPVTFGGEGEGYADFDAGEVTLALFPRDLMAQSIGAGDVVDAVDVTDGQDRVAICLGVDDVDATMQDLQGRGAVFVSGPIDQPFWELRVAHLRDPDGTLIEISHSIPVLDA